MPPAPAPLATWFVAVAAALPLAAQEVLEAAEPNATTATATVLPCGAEALGSLSSLVDADWFRITLTATSDLRLATGPGLGSAIADTVLVLLDSTGAPLRNSDDGVRCGHYSQLDAPSLSAGTYYVAVEAGANAAPGGGSYVLDVRCAAPAAFVAPPLFAEGPENNDPRSGGTSTLVSLPARCNGQIPTVGATGDWDFYRFLLLGESFVQARVAATASHPQTPRLDDPVLYLFDASTPPNLLAGPFYASDFAVWDTAIDVRLPPGGYQIAIRGFAGSVGGRYYLDLHRTDAARVTVHPGGCGGRSAGLTVATTGPGAPTTVERPVLGTTYSVVGSNLGSGGFGFHLVGFASTALDLTAAGAPGCTYEVLHLDAILRLADGAGFARYAVAIPETLTLLGTTLQSQIAVLDFSNPLGLTFSNRVSAVVGP